MNELTCMILGKVHVVVEPVAITTEGTKELFDTARKYHAIFQSLSYSRRLFGPTFVKLRFLVPENNVLQFSSEITRM